MPSEYKFSEIVRVPGPDGQMTEVSLRPPEAVFRNVPVFSSSPPVSPVSKSAPEILPSSPPSITSPSPVLTSSPATRRARRLAEAIVIFDDNAPNRNSVVVPATTTPVRGYYHHHFSNLFVPLI